MAARSALCWQGKVCLNRPGGTSSSELRIASRSLLTRGKPPAPGGASSPESRRWRGGQECPWTQAQLEQPGPFPQTLAENIVHIYVTVQKHSKEGNLGCLCILLGHVSHSFPFTSLPKPARLGRPRWPRKMQPCPRRASSCRDLPSQRRQRQKQRLWKGIRLWNRRRKLLP